MDITILGIESSCDDTSAAVLRNNVLLSNVIASQAVHVKYGGVIPELASRAHQQNIIPVVDTALKEAGVAADRIDAIAFTRGPGLVGSLLVGVSFTKGLSIARNIPMVEVNHLQGHILSHFIDLRDRTLPHPTSVPVSPGQRRPHADRAGGLPAGDADRRHDDRRRRRRSVRQVCQSDGTRLSGRAGDRPAGQGGRPRSLPLRAPPRRRIRYSFSGLKTSFLYTLRDAVAADPDFIETHKADLCASLQHTIVEILLKQLVRAAKEYDIRDIAVAGGVSANSGLRNGVVEEGRRRGWRTFVPEFRFTTDNAAMIAVAGYYHYLHGDFSSLDVSPVARIEELM